MNKINQIKKIFLVFSALVVVFIIVNFLEKSKTSLVLKKENVKEKAVFSLFVNDEIIYSHTSGQDIYLFVPSYVKNSAMLLDESIEYFSIDGVEIHDKWDFDYNRMYLCSINDNGQLLEFNFMVMKSDFVNTIHIHTESGTMDNVWADKDYREAGVVSIYGAEGNLYFSGNLEYIKGRGNTSWDMEKKPYVIKLEEEAPLFGMDESKKWILLANAYESTKIAYKLSMDMAIEMGMDTTPECHWAELYLNGVYEGNYLIAEKIDSEMVDPKGQDLEHLTEELNGGNIQKNTLKYDNYKGVVVANQPEDISGTYIIEKDMTEYYDNEISGFITDDGNKFTIKCPENATIEQVSYIMEITQNVENMLKSNDEQLFEFFDIDSMAKRYLLDFVSGNADVGLNSVYFYKKQGDEVLYSGPVWDYDWALENIRFQSEDVITWFAYLENNEQFKQYCREVYIEVVRPYMVKLIEDGVDEYARTIASSFEMDRVRWMYVQFYYDSFDANVRYIKYFLCNKINELDAVYGITDQEKVEFVGTGEMRYIKVIFGEDEVIYEVPDGQLLNVDTTGWDRNGVMFDNLKPILENAVYEKYAEKQ